jgi:hypothetical protein
VAPPARGRSAATGAQSTWRVVPLRRDSTAVLGSTREYTIGAYVLLLPADATNAEVEAVTAGRFAVLPIGACWQPVMWNEAFNRLTPGQTVCARIGAERARVVLDTADGRVWPAGPLRDKPFNRRTRVVGYFAAPSGSRVLPGRLYTVAPLAGLVVAAPFILRAGLLLPLLTILLGYSIGMFIWAWRGGLPAAV